MNSKNIFSLMAIAAMLLLFIDADAQHRRGVRHRRGGSKILIGPIVGANMSKITGDFSEEFDWKPGFHAGVFFNVGVVPRLVLEPVLLYSMKGSQLAEESSFKLNLNYADLLLNAKVRVGYDENLNFFAGPYTGYLIAANAVAGAESEDVTENFFRFDFGVNAGGGYQLSNGIGFSLRFQLGLSNINADIIGQSFVPVNHNGVGMLSVMYMAGKSRGKSRSKAHRIYDY
jgi:hypothetical protein